MFYWCSNIDNTSLSWNISPKSLLHLQIQKYRYKVVNLYYTYKPEANLHIVLRFCGSASVMDSQIQIHKQTNTQTYKYTNTQIHKYRYKFVVNLYSLLSWGVLWVGVYNGFTPTSFGQEIQLRSRKSWIIIFLSSTSPTPTSYCCRHIRKEKGIDAWVSCHDIQLQVLINLTQEDFKVES